MSVPFEPLEGRVLFSAGLSAQYFDNANLTKQKLTRIDPNINFDWGTASPSPSIGADTFSARWTGYLQAQYGENYTLTTTSDDGVRVWVDGNLLIDRWNSAPGTGSASVNFTAGSYHALKVEYFENTGTAKMQLQWSSASTPLQAISSDHLFTEIPPAAESQRSLRHARRNVQRKLVERRPQNARGDHRDDRSCDDYQLDGPEPR